MKNRDIARRIVCGFINASNWDYDDKLIELASVNASDDVLLEHIDVMLKILKDAKKEIKENKRWVKMLKNKYLPTNYVY